eukprot:TRINITY_DN16645_c0_g1_i1.p1 TRINITY_DN16645_c0_g1~~TRINITY_DN16645_c0_g1_i1.p1  ORF type:complete len:279 (+),score=76.96 TRINITY_DN16645_c0_g1_i1:1-837(+)
MPIKREEIIKISILIASKCTKNPRVIALVGKQLHGKLSSETQKKADSLKSKGILLEASGAPFGKLFPEMNAVVIHGGLGTTAEALRAGIPIIVTGSMLMDQRFWGAHCYNLGIAPPPCHISEFPSVCVGHVDQALKEDNVWALKAKEIAKEMCERLVKECEVMAETDGVSDDDGLDGIRINVKTVVRLSVGLEYFNSLAVDQDKKGGGGGAGSLLESSKTVTFDLKQSKYSDKIVISQGGGGGGVGGDNDGDGRSGESSGGDEGSVFSPSGSVSSGEK